MADEGKKIEEIKTTDNVEVKSDKSVDPQLILSLGTKDNMPFNAKIEVDLIVRNAKDHRVFGHAKTLDYVTTSEVTIPINFNDSIKEWKRACGIPGARLGYGVNIHLFDQDGNETQTYITKYMVPTFEPPIKVDGVWNQYENDKPEDDSSVGSPIAAGTILTKGDKFYGPNGVFCLSFQEDGNLVVKAIDGDYFHWGSHNHAGAPLNGDHARVHTDGNLHIYNANNELLWKTEAVGGAAVFISNNGSPIILDQNGNTVWTGSK